jgi:hypothetical protein
MHTHDTLDSPSKVSFTIFIDFGLYKYLIILKHFYYVRYVLFFSIIWAIDRMIHNLYSCFCLSTSIFCHTRVSPLPPRQGVEYRLGFSGQHEHDLKTGAQSTALHEIIWARLARLEGVLRPGLKFRPVGPQDG